MVRAKHLIFAGIGAMAALSIYGAAATKKASKDNGHSNRLARIEALMDEGGVKYRASFFRRNIKHHTEERIAALEPAKTVTEVAPKAPAKPDPKAEEAKKAAEKKAADEKKKKEDEAKKKKKKKKKKGDTSPEASPTAPQDEAKADDKKPEDSPAATVSSGGTTVSYMGNTNPNQNPESVDDWVSYLSTYPTVEKLNHFIQLAQVNSVKPDVFFPVCEKLLTMDGRMPEFSVTALGSVTSEPSFEYLADVANEVTLPDSLKSKATAYMNMYARVEYVRFLGAAVNSKDPVAAVDAINLIQRSIPGLKAVVAAQASTAASTSSTGTPGATATTARSPASSIVKIYEEIHTNLVTASSSGIDSSVRTAAQTMAPQIAALLATLDPSSTTASAGTKVSFNGF